MCVLCLTAHRFHTRPFTGLYVDVPLLFLGSILCSVAGLWVQEAVKKKAEEDAAEAERKRREVRKSCCAYPSDGALVFDFAVRTVSCNSLIFHDSACCRACFSLVACLSVVQPLSC